MKYFTEVDSQGNGRASLRVAQGKESERKFKAYQKQLTKLQGRISQQAWNFFAFGFGGWGLHDARLLAFTAGDGLECLTDRSRRFDQTRQKAKARILFLNREQTLSYSFVCSDIRMVAFNYPIQDQRWNFGRIELLETYELKAANKHYLSLEFLFSSKATLLIEFGRLKFDRNRVPRG
jgi:hypothetical protein